MQIIFCLSDKFNQWSEDCKKSSIGSAGEGCEQMRGQKQRERKEKQLCPFWGQQVCWAVEHKEKSPEFCVQLLPWTNTAVGSSDQQFTNTREQIRVLAFFPFSFSMVPVLFRISEWSGNNVFICPNWTQNSSWNRRSSLSGGISLLWDQVPAHFSFDHGNVLLQLS